MRSFSTLTHKGNFTGNDVTPCHFVTSDDGPCTRSSLVGVAKIQRHFQPSADVDALIEALYKLLTDPTEVAAESACVPRRTRVRNVS
jgi:hypothetical protein